MNQSNNILVTGGTGFVGAYIIKELVEKGYNVRAIRRSNKLPAFISSEIFQNTSSGSVQWVEGDVLDIISLEDAMKGVDYVIHAAASVSFAKKDRQNLYQVNIEGTANVVNTAMENNIKKLIHISSIGALGRKTGSSRVNEETKWVENKFTTHYAISKYRAEMEVWRAMAEGLNAIIVNPATVLGYGDWNQSSSAIFKNVYNEFPWYTNGVNGFVDVEDVARAVIQLLESDINGERFIVSGENLVLKEVFDMIADGFGKKRPFRHATPFLGEIAWRLEKIKSIFTGKSPLLTKETAKIAHTKTFFENDKLLKALPGFQFTPLKETIARACHLYKEAVKK